MDTPEDDFETMLRTDELQEVVALCDADGIILSWNRAGEEITGFPREDVIGYHIDSVISAGSREIIDEIMDIQRFGSVLPGLPLRLQTSFGWEVPAEVTSVPRQFAGGGTGFLLIFRDVTLKTQLQEELDRMDVLYRGLVEGSPDIVYVLDAHARLLFINDTVETLLGYSKRDLIGRELIDLVHPEDRQRAYWPLRERRRADRATRNLRLRLLTKDGQTRRYDLGFVYVSLDSVGLGHRGSAAHIPPEEHLGTQGVARDVTELVLLQEFSRQAELILPVCSVCRKIRVSVDGRDVWMTLHDYVEQKTGVMYSHTYCPDHEPPHGERP
ncbi:MAG: PAS domain-containing protein [Spirochaetia bacterium]|jgi:PAS domain S-box-containing protein